MEEINDTTQIINLLKTAENLSLTTYARVGLTEFPGIIKGVSHSNFYFLPTFKFNLPGNLLHLAFNYLKNYYYFTTSIISKTSKKVELEIPKIIYKHFKRRAKRYELPSGIENVARIHLITSKKDITTTSKSLSIEKELEKPIPDLKFIAEKLYHRNKEKYSIYKIYFPLKEIKNKVVEETILKFKKPFVINNADNPGSYQKNNLSTVAVSYCDYFIKIKNISPNKIEKYALQISEKYKKAGIGGECYVPIWLLGHLRGYIYAARKNTQSFQLISREEIENLEWESMVFAEAVLKNRLNTLSKESIGLKIKDLSINGLGCIVEDKLLFNVLDIDMKVNIEAKINKNKFSGIGVIKRKERGNLLGIEFIELNPKDETVLLNIIENLRRGMKP